MLSDTRSTPVRSPAPGVIPDTIPGPVSDQPLGRSTEHRSRAGSRCGGERRPRHGAERFRRKALRGRLHGYAIATVALVAVLIALAASNTAPVKVNWLIGSSHVSLVWLVLVTAIVGWLLGLLASARFNWLTRAPRRGGATS